MSRHRDRDRQRQGTARGSPESEFVLVAAGIATATLALGMTFAVAAAGVGAGSLTFDLGFSLSAAGTAAASTLTMSFWTPAKAAGVAGWWEVGVGTTLVTGPVTATGTAPPAVTFTGTPSVSTNSVEVDISTTGARGTATFQWKLNGSVQQTAQTTAATFVLGATGITANFPVGAYTNDDVYTCPTTVSQINDQISNKNLVQATASLQPTWTQQSSSLNNHAVCSFLATQSSGGIGATITTIASPWTVYVVYRSTGARTTESAIWGTGSASAGALFFHAYHAVVAVNAAGASVLQGPSASGNDTNPHVVAFTNGSGTSASLYLDSSGSPTITGNGGTASATKFFFGYGAVDTNNPLNGDIAEGYICTGNHATAEVARAMGYYAHKYNFSAS